MRTVDYHILTEEEQKRIEKERADLNMANYSGAARKRVLQELAKVNGYINSGKLVR